MSKEEQLLKNVVDKTSMLDLMSGANGTIKLNGTAAYSAQQFKAVCFSEDSEVTAISDSLSGDRDDYFAVSTYTVKAGDILVARGVPNGTRFTSIELASGSAILIL